MAKRQLNKNLVGILTATGMIVAVGVVTVATMNAAQKDPTVLARQAQEAEQAGNLRRARELYGRAYNVNHDVQYMIESARIAYRTGEVGEAIGQLMLASAQAPEHVGVLTTLLDRFWELRRAGIDQRQNMRDYSDRLLDLEPDNLIGLVTRAEALEGLRAQDPEYARLAKEALDKALEIDEKHPLVATVRAQRIMNDARIAARSSRDPQRLLVEARERVLELLKASIAAHPDDPDLITTLAGSQWEAGETDAARETLERAVARFPEDVDIHFLLARVYNSDARRLARDGADPDAVAERVAAARRHIETTLSLEPGLYDVYTLRADNLMVGWRNDGRWEREPHACQQEIVQLYTNALRDTLQLKSVRAVLGRGALVRMIVQAFDTTMSFHHELTDPARRKEMIAHAERFYDEARTRFPESVVAPLMEGQLAVVRQDARTAIAAFRQAEERAGEVSPLFARMAQENLALLYREVNELGSSLRYTDVAIQSYRAEELEVPMRLWINRGQILVLLERAQEALDLADQALRTHPDDRELRRIRATALAMLGRSEDARAALGDADEADLEMMLTRARFAAHEHDYDEAERLLRQIIASNPDHIGAITLLMQVFTRAERQEAAAELIRDLLARDPSPEMRRILTAYEVVVTTADRAERDAKVLELIKQIPDPRERAAEFYNFFVSRGEPASAVPYLDELEKIEPDDEQILRLQFELALTVGDFPKAERYIVPLSRRNVDRADGAVLRGMLKAAQGDPEAALRDFRIAEARLPGDVVVQLRIAQALLQLAPPRAEDAIEALRQALLADPRNFQANKLMYACHEQLGRHNEGLPYLQQAARINPADPFIQQRQQIIEEENDPAKGLAWREPLREREPFNIDNLLRLTDLYARLGREAESEDALRAAAAAAPGERRVAQAAALFYAQRDNHAEGERIIRDHIAIARGYFKIQGYALLARYYEALNRQEDATGALAEALRLCDEDIFVNEEERRGSKVAVLAEQAEYHLRRGQLAERVETLRAALALIKPDEVTPRQNALLKIMKALIQLRDFAQAEAAINEYAREFPTDPRGAMAHAELLISFNVTTERLEQAREICTRMLQDAPDHRWCLFTRGKISLALRRYDEARADLLKLKALSPLAYNLEHRFLLARLYELQNQLELAESELRELAALSDPPNPNVALQLVAFLKRTNQVTKAQEFVNRLVARYPREPFWPYQLGLLLKERGEHSAAVAPLERAAELTSAANPAVLTDLLETLVKANRARDAIGLFERLEPQVAVPAIRAQAAAAYLSTGNREEAVRQLNAAAYDAATQRPADIGPVVNRLNDSLAPAEAEGVLRDVIDRTSGDAAMRMRCALARLLINRRDADKRPEVRSLIDSVRAEVADGSPLHLESMLIEALLLDQDGQAPAAAQVYERILERDPSNVAALNNLAYMMVESLERPAEAVPYAERAAELLPDNGNILDTLGWAYLKSGNLNLAETTLLEAMRLEPDNVTVLSHVAHLYAQTHRTADARRLYNRVLESARRQQNTEYIQKTEEALRALP